MKSKFASKAMLSIFAVSVATLVPALAQAEMRHSPEFGEYSESAITYGNDYSRTYGEWGESKGYFDFGNTIGWSNFGAGFNTYGRTHAAKSSLKAETSAVARLTTNVTVFGHGIDIVEVYADANTRTRPALHEASVRVLLVGLDVFSRRTTQTYSYPGEKPLFSQSFSKAFYPGGIRVEVGAGASGRVFWNYGGGVDPYGAKVFFQAGAGLYASAFVQVGHPWLVGGKIAGNTTLFDSTASFTAQQKWEFAPARGGCKATLWRGANGNITTTMLSGSLRVQGQLFGLTKTENIHSWGGWQWNAPLFGSEKAAFVATDPFACLTVGS